MVGETPGFVYLDHAATTPIREEVLSEMLPYLTDFFGNPSSIHSLGLNAKYAVDAARRKISSIIGANPSEGVFTAGGTESVNLAILGTAGMNPGFHAITTSIEHHSVLNSFKSLENTYRDITVVPVDKLGFITPSDLEKRITPKTRLLSVMYANNEVGTIQKISDISQWLKKLNQKRQENGFPQILFHTDACQASGLLDINVNNLGVDLMSINASKIYGPKQVGLLYVREGVELNPLLYGGGQERNLRSGTENVPGIIGFAKALELAQQERFTESHRLRELRDYLILNVLENIPGSILNGPGVDSAENPSRLPSNANFSFSKTSGKMILEFLDSKGFLVSTGSACSSNQNKPSHVLTAISCPKDYINGSIRVSLGRKNTLEEIKNFIETLTFGVRKMRETTIVVSDLQSITGKQTDEACTKMN